MPRPVLYEGAEVANVATAARAGERAVFPSPVSPPNWFTVPNYNSPIMDVETGTIGMPWYNLLVFISTRASYISQLYQGLIDTNTNVTALTARVTALEGRMNTAEANITNLQSRMSTAEANIVNLQSRMSTAEANIANLQGRVSSLEGRVSSIEARLAAAGIP